MSADSDFIVLDEYVKMTWAPVSCGLYRKLGYEFTRLGDTFRLKVSDLAPGSHAKVRVRCPDCLSVRVVRYFSIVKAGHTLCRGCATRRAAFKDVAGQRFGRLVAIRPDGKEGNNTVWLCRCDSGAETHVPIDRLTSGKTQSSGCLNLDYLRGRTGRRHHRFRDVGGQRFGRLVAVELVGRTSNGQAIWLCECDCGNAVEVALAHLGESTVSCGCYNRDRMTGEGNPNWDPGLSPGERGVQRHVIVPGYDSWVRQVKERDDYTCQVCGEQSDDGTGMVSHHLNAWGSFPEQRDDLDNGVCLCKSCHIAFHAEYGWGANTVEQFELFLSELENGG